MGALNKKNVERGKRKGRKNHVNAVKTIPSLNTLSRKITPHAVNFKIFLKRQKNELGSLMTE